MNHFRDRFPFPVAHRPDVGAMVAAAAAAIPVRRTHAVNVAMPYLQRWSEERDAAIGQADPAR
jgi:hypothetical protein